MLSEARDGVTEINIWNNWFIHITSRTESRVKHVKDTEVSGHFEFSCQTPADQRQGQRGFLQPKRRWELTPLGTEGIWLKENYKILWLIKSIAQTVFSCWLQNQASVPDLRLFCIYYLICFIWCKTQVNYCIFLVFHHTLDARWLTT